MKPCLPCLALFFICTICCADTGDALQLSVSSGKAPLTVRITGPSKLTDLGRGSMQKWVGCGFNVTWNDDSPQSPNPAKECKAYLEHVFAKPGEYTVKAETIHPNPDDSHSVDWSASAKVVVK